MKSALRELDGARYNGHTRLAFMIQFNDKSRVLWLE